MGADLRCVRAAYTGDLRYMGEGPLRVNDMLVSFYVKLTETEWTLYRVGPKLEGVSGYREDRIAGGSIRNPTVDETPLDYKAIAADLLGRYSA